MEDNSKVSLVEHYARVAQFLPLLSTIDFAVIVADNKTYKAYQPAKAFALDIRPSFPIRQESALAAALEKGERVTLEVEAAVSGVEYIGTAFPLFDMDGKVIGAVEIAVLPRDIYAVSRLSNILCDESHNLKDVFAKVEQSTKGIVELTEKLNEACARAEKQVKETNKVLEFTKKVADLTKMLGFSAAIEAARVGDQNRGFGVVSNDVSKLATDGADSVNQIASILANIRQSVTTIKESTKEIGELTQTQIAAASQAGNGLQGFEGFANQLKEITERKE